MSISVPLNILWSADANSAARQIVWLRAPDIISAGCSAIFSQDSCCGETAGKLFKALDPRHLQAFSCVYLEMMTAARMPPDLMLCLSDACPEAGRSSGAVLLQLPELPERLMHISYERHDARPPE